LTKNSNLRGLLFATATALLWGFLAIAIKVAVVSVDAYSIVWFRFAVAFSVLGSYYLIKKPKTLKILVKPPPLLIIASLGLGLNYILYVKGLEYTGANSVQILIQMGPMMLIVAGVLVFKEKINRRQLLGIGIALIGFYFFYNEQFQTLVNDYQDFKLGVLIIFLSASCWVIYAVLQKILVKDYPPQQLNLFIYFLPAILFIPFVDFAVFPTLGLGDYLLLAFLGLNTLLAYGFLGEAFKHTEANKVSMIITMNPIITLVSMTVLYYLEVTWVKTELTSTLGFFGALLFVVGAVTAVISSNKGS